MCLRWKVQGMRNPILKTLQDLVLGSDEQAMWRVKMHDDADAFSQLVRRWEKPIRNLCARMTGDLHRADDLSQETFSRLFARRADYEPSGKFSTYLWRIAMNQCYDELRRRKRRSEFALPTRENDDGVETEIEFVAPDSTPSQSLLEQERADIVRQALLRLPENYRSVLVLKHYENLKFREIAEVLEIPEGTVKSRMAEALNQLHKQLRRAFADKEVSLWKNTSRRTEELMVL